MIKYIAREVRDINGTIIGYTDIKRAPVGGATALPRRGKWGYLFGSDLFTHRKAEVVDGTWRVVEDLVERGNSDAARAARDARILNIRNSVADINSRLDAAASVPELRAELKLILRDMMELIVEGK